MHYLITSMDGGAAASRGRRNDRQGICEGEVLWPAEAAYIACLLKLLDDHLDDNIDAKDIPTLEDEYFEMYGGEDGGKLLKIKTAPLEWLKNHNLDDVDGGSCWITRIRVQSRTIFLQE